MGATKASATLRTGMAAGNAVALLSVAYAMVLGIGLLTLPSPGMAIQDPWFTAMELLILALAPTMVALMAAIHAGAPAGRKSLALLGIVFMGMCTVITCSVHFAMLTLGRQAAFATGDWATLVFSFHWPSVAYALDILAWDVFFPLAALCAACSVPGIGLARLARRCFFASAILAFAGLVGVPMANMSARNVGIIGYAVLFPIAAFLLALHLRRTARHGAI